MGIIAIINVTTATPAERLSPDDQEVAGIYGVVMGDGIGEYSDTPRKPPEDGENPLEEAALDVFHDKIGIDSLDDFEVDVHILPPADDAPDDVQWL